VWRVKPPHKTHEKIKMRLQMRQTVNACTFLLDKRLILFALTDFYKTFLFKITVDNIHLYYVDPSDSDFAKLGLNYTVKGETNLIGVHVEGDYSRATGDMYAIMGMKLWAEYLDGIAVATVTPGG
jgi:hypothetical protein